jgi:ESS family glutamate:Na+ symporter
MAATFLPYLVAFGWVSVFILISVFLRAKIPFLQKSLAPTSIIAGILGFLAINLGLMWVPTPEGAVRLTPGTFGVITFHLFAIGFVGIGLLKNKPAGSSKEHNKIYWRGSLWIALVFTLSYALQSTFGYAVFEGWQALTGEGANPILGYLLGAGFTQGPGQTLAYATIWEGAPYHVPNAVNIGMAFAASGFFISVFVGVPLAKYGLKRGWGTLEESKSLPQSFVVGILPEQERTACGHTITHPSNVDTFGYHLAIIFFSYGLAYCFGIAWQRFIPFPLLAPLGIGFVFLWSLLIGKLVRFSLGKLKADHMIDNGTVRRFVGMSVDFMVASVFMSIEVKAIQSMIIPLVVAIVFGAVGTMVWILWYGRRAPELGFERTLATFGTCTGTVATGLLLLRIADPEFETSVAEELGMMNFLAMVFITPMIYFGFPFAAKEGYPMLWILVGTMIVMLIALKACKLVHKPKF